MTEPICRRPTWIRRWLVNPLVRNLVLRGRLGQGEQNLMRVLRVRGRRSGREFDIPVRVAVYHGQQYVVSLLGQTEWARNLRAAGTAQLILGPAIDHRLVKHRETGREPAATSPGFPPSAALARMPQ